MNTSPTARRMSARINAWVDEHRAIFERGEGSISFHWSGERIKIEVKQYHQVNGQEEHPS